MQGAPRRGRAARGWRLGVVVAVGVAPMMMAAPAAASSLDGCSGTVTSLDADGQVIDAATASGGEIVDDIDGGEAFTASNPFVIDNGGSVQYSGRSDTVITDHSWGVSLLGVEVASGGSANASKTQEDEGTYDLGEEFPISFTGLIRVEGDLTGTGGSCSGDGYVKVQGNPLTSPFVLAGGAATLGGGALLFWSRPRVRPVKGAMA